MMKKLGLNVKTALFLFDKKVDCFILASYLGSPLRFKQTPFPVPNLPFCSFTHERVSECVRGIPRKLDEEGVKLPDK